MFRRSKGSVLKIQITNNTNIRKYFQLAKDKKEEKHAEKNKQEQFHLICFFIK